ncbi:MAG: cation diffusion facilitator family transporter [Planctomycetota bacterium]|jgi:cobalt-zinc-cadmium efflux system protein
MSGGAATAGPPPHTHGPDRSASGRALMIALVLTSVTLTVEVVAGWWSGSLALLADAGHMLSDAAALGLALFAARVAARAPDGRRSFGHYRAEILAALANGVLLVGIAVAIGVEAIGRIGGSPEIDSTPMLVAAVIGLVVNLICASVLHRASHEGMNVHGAFLHVLGDTLGSVAAITAGVVIATTGWMLIDVIAAGVVGVLILVSAVRLVVESVDVLLESVPRHLDLGEIEQGLAAVDGVESIHDLHVWCVTTGYECLSAHVVVAGGADGEAVLNALAEVCVGRFAIDHTTFQLEWVDRKDREHVH